MTSPENPCGVKPSTLASWMEYPCPVPERFAVRPFTVWLIGSEVWMGALSKSNSTGCADAGETCTITPKIRRAKQMGRIEPKFRSSDSFELFKCQDFIARPHSCFAIGRV